MPEISLMSLLIDIEQQLKEEITALDTQLVKSREITGNSSVPHDLPPSREDEETERIVNQLIAFLNNAADAYNASEAAFAESNEAQQARTDSQVVALQEEENKLPPQQTVKPNTIVTEEQKEVTSTTQSQPQQAAASATSAPSASPQPPVTNNTKGGMLLNYGKDRFMRSFQSNYLVVSDGVGTSAPAGVSWYDSEATFRKGGNPIDSIPFFVVEKNSRGSMFKKASVCWPLVTTEDCPKLASADKNKVYFAVDYTNQKSGKTDLVVLGAASEAERNEWVTFITKFLALYLPPGEEFEPFINFPVGANPPLHVNEVLGGEAPGSAQRVIDPTKR